MRIYGLLLCGWMTVSLQAQQIHDWENHHVLQINREPARAAFVPFAKQKGDCSMSLDGMWKFRWTPVPSERIADFYRTDFNDEDWKSFPVPANWEINGYGTPIYVSAGYPFKIDPPRVMGEPKASYTTYKERNPVGQYRRTFTLLSLTASQWGKEIQVQTDQNTVIARHPSGEIVALTFTPDVSVKGTDNNYQAKINGSEHDTYVAISFYTGEKELSAGLQKAQLALSNPQEGLKANKERWEGYLTKILRKDMKPEYDRIAVKAVVTLISNWRTHRGGLLHEGIVPSHAAYYFVGFWAWDTWRFSAALAKFDPELAKDNIRAMFDYQQPDGMIIDCIYTDPAENNARDSKPPLVSWAVDEIFTHTNDTAFISEMYPQLMAYYKWWYNKRDHNRNGMCEYGSTDGTLEAAAWESGMDNAIRFDDAKMLKNDGAEDAWSMDQESVDLNAYLALECKLLKKFAGILGVTFDGPDYSSQVADYFFDKEKGFFFDRRLKDGSFIQEPGCEAYTPLWTEV